jgi:hypothetical protein
MFTHFHPSHPHLISATQCTPTVFLPRMSYLSVFDEQESLLIQFTPRSLNARQALRNGVVDATPMVTALRVATIRTENQTHRTTSDLGIKTNTFVNTQSEREDPSFNMMKVEPV